MFAKRLFQKSASQSGSKILSDLDLQIAAHYGVPYTASVLAFDPIQRLLAIGTLDGRIKIIGGDNIEGLLISPKKLPFKNLEFLHNQGFLVGVSNENDIQVWDLECRCLRECLQWESNITAFSTIQGTCLMYVGDDSGLISVLKYNPEEGKVLSLPYQITSDALNEAAGISFSSQQAIVGILPQPYTFGTRVLVAYENGVIILWDVSECRVVTVRGYTELQLKDKGTVGTPAEVGDEQQDSVPEHGAHEREICSLCWASDTGSILAVGYINGDILLWNISAKSSTKEQQAGLSTNDVVKLQLASGDRRLPVIILHWSNNCKSNNDKGGQLFIYGGDEMGSDEVLTVLSLEWSSGIENLRCISRVDLNLDGSFADMILIPKPGALGRASTAALFILTNPGQLNVYDGDLLANLKSEDGKPSQQFEKFPTVVPTIDPLLTVAKLCWLAIGSSNAFIEKASARGTGATSSLSTGTKWPLTGGVPNELAFPKENGIARLYIAGYQDGSVRIWDATSPVLSLMFVFEAKVSNIELEGQNSSVSALEFCSKSMTLAVGNEFGLVRVYKLQDGIDQSNFHFVSETKHEVHKVQQGNGVHCFAAFFILNSPIRALHIVNSGDRFAVGYENGQVSMLDISSMSVIFRTGCLSGTNSPVISITTHLTPQSSVILHSPKQSSPESAKVHSEEVVYVLTKDACVVMVDSITGSMINLRPMHPRKESAAISMYVLDGSDAPLEAVSEKNMANISTDNPVQNESKQSNNPSGIKTHESEHHFSSDASYILLCCENALRLYPLKSVVQGDTNFIRKVNLEKNCCWATLFKRRDEKACGLILLYQTGVIEIRSLPDLEVLGESSLMSTLRWSFKANMEKTISSYDFGQIALVNGCEVAFLSLLACENDFRIPDSLPCLHDKVVAAAADAAIGLYSHQKKKQDTTHGILGLIKGLKSAKAEKANVADNSVRPISTQQLEEIFARTPFSDPTIPSASNLEATELSIDDIEIDDALPATSTSSVINKNKARDEDMEREKLFQGGSTDAKPRVRSTQEILTQYRFNGDAAAAAAHAKDKLVQRQEKLERLNKRTEELQSGAENFAELANELVKTMENKKWWKL
ncbi:syntaxin-binding protein 5 [Dioscorea alata]|uniref:Syntaxin-binding protein 5 n=1 Tax=Dioscorea alata TaxID=55571 RepID=A0ACB7VU02_DIOAL|nr:syntaxin-binding protein 5 [Dioscorea alata]